MQEHAYYELSNLGTDYWWYRGQRRIFETLLRELGDVSSKSVLEIGCGPGLNLMSLFSGFGSKTGLDASELAVELAAKNLGDQARILVGDANDLKVEGTFNLVAFLYVLYHQNIRSPGEVLAKVCDLVAPGGWLFVTEPALRCLRGRHSEVVHEARRFTLDGLESMVAAAGFTVRRATYWGVLPAALLYVKRRVLERLFPTDLEDQATDGQRVPAWVESALYCWLNIEGMVIPRTNLPVGAWAVILAQKD